MIDNHGHEQPKKTCDCCRERRGFFRVVAFVLSRQTLKRALVATLYFAGMVAILNDLFIIVGRTLFPAWGEGAKTVILERVFENFSSFLGG